MSLIGYMIAIPAITIGVLAAIIIVGAPILAAIYFVIKVTKYIIKKRKCTVKNIK